MKTIHSVPNFQVPLQVLCCIIDSKIDWIRQSSDTKLKNEYWIEYCIVIIESSSWYIVHCEEIIYHYIHITNSYWRLSDGLRVHWSTKAGQESTRSCRGSRILTESLVASAKPAPKSMIWGQVHISLQLNLSLYHKRNCMKICQVIRQDMQTIHTA